MIYISIFLSSFILTYLVKYFAIKNSLVAQINERSSHTVPTPHGGGIAIALIWFVGLIYLYVNSTLDDTLFYALLLGALLSIVSYMDDLYELSAKIRLLVQVGVALGGLFLLGGLHHLNFGIFIIENQVVTNIFALFLIVWFINLYNFLDGIDGYAASEMIFLSLAGFMLFQGEQFLLLLFAVLGFLVWNWEKAKIFMGDVGSTLLGYNVAVFSIYYANEAAQNLWIWIILFGLFWFDATLTLYRRFRNGEKLSLAHRKHAYQRLIQSGWSHQKVVIASIGINIILFLIVYFLSNLFVAFIIATLFLYGLMRFIDLKKRFE